MKNLPMPAKANDPKRQVQFIEFFMIQGSLSLQLFSPVINHLHLSLCTSVNSNVHRFCLWRIEIPIDSRYLNSVDEYLYSISTRPFDDQSSVLGCRSAFSWYKYNVCRRSTSARARLIPIDAVAWGTSTRRCPPTMFTKS